MRPYTVTVTGPTGKTGSAIAELACNRGWQVRAAARRRPEAGEWVPLDWDDAATWEPAFAGSDAAYVLLPFNHPGAAERTPQLLTAAGEAGVSRIVLLTSWDAANEAAGGPLTTAERTLQELPVTATILRPTWFLDNFTVGSFADMAQQGTLRLPAGQAAIPFIDVRDIAAVAVEALAEDGPQGVLPLTGPQAVDHHRVARALSDAFGAPIRYTPVTVEEFAAELSKRGFGIEYGRFLGAALDDVASGTIKIAVEDTVDRIVGRRPYSVEEFARHHAALRAGTPAKRS